MGSKVIYLAALPRSEAGSSIQRPSSAANRQRHRVRTARAIRHCLTSLLEEAMDAKLQASVLALQLAIDAISGDLAS